MALVSSVTGPFKTTFSDIGWVAVAGEGKVLVDSDKDSVIWGIGTDTIVPESGYETVGQGPYGFTMDTGEVFYLYVDKSLPLFTVTANNPMV